MAASVEELFISGLSGAAPVTLIWLFDRLRDARRVRTAKALEDGRNEVKDGNLEARLAENSRLMQHMDECFDAVKISLAAFKATVEEQQRNNTRTIDRLDRGFSNLQAQIRMVATSSDNKLFTSDRRDE
jgi:hypothetical protein